MKKILVVAAALALAACGSSSSSSHAPAAPVPLSVRGNIVIGQQVPLMGDETYGAAPGSANVWDLYEDFSLDDGNDDQFDGALKVLVGPLAVSPPTFASVTAEYGGTTLVQFPHDQTYEELSYFGPVARAADGVHTVAVAAASTAYQYDGPIDGTYSAYLLPTSNSRLSQQVTLAAAAGATITLAFTDQVGTYDGSDFIASTTAPYGEYYRVVVRSTGGAELETLLDDTSSSGPHSYDLTAYAGQTVVLSFEYRSNAYAYGIIDDVSVTSTAAPATNLIQNGDFETGTLAHWTASDDGEPTGISSGVRTVGGLDVQRFFYTVPSKKWARWADVFTNPGATAVTTDVVTFTDLGSDGGGMIYTTDGGKALAEWDTAIDGDRDLGMAFGDEQALFQPVSDFSRTRNGSDSVFFVKHLTVPAGKSVVLVHFIVLNGNNTGLIATDLTARATDIEHELSAIVNGIHSDPQYLSGLTAEQIAAITNW